MPEHSPEPWGIQEVGREDAAPCYRINHASHTAQEFAVAVLDGEIHYSPKADADRIVACVNACRGIPTEHLTPPEGISCTVVLLLGDVHIGNLERHFVDRCREYGYTVEKEDTDA